MVSQGAGLPDDDASNGTSTAARFIGEIYIDTSAGQAYIAIVAGGFVIGTNWKKITV